MTSPIPFPLPRAASVDLLRVSKVRARRSLLCSDIVGYTALLSRLGDVAALQIVRRHDAIVRACARAHAGDELELRGDGFLMSFARRADALACAIDVQRELARDRAEHGDGGVHVRIGLHTGDVLLERGRYFGLEVVVPFRLLDFAGADEIWVSGSLPEATPGVRVSRAQDLELKGIPRPVRAYQVDWDAPPCMAVDDGFAQAGAAPCGQA
jgi:class 3 adenylate cyclase